MSRSPSGVADWARTVDIADNGLLFPWFGVAGCALLLFDIADKGLFFPWELDDRKVSNEVGLAPLASFEPEDST